MAAGAVAGYASADHPSLSKGAREFHLATYFSGTGVFGPVRVYPALRGDAYVGAGGEKRASVNPRLGLNIKPSEAHPLFLKVNGGRAYGAPTFNDRYWQPGGNPDLRAERSWSYEAGIFLEARPQVELTFFESRTADQIVWQPQRNGIWIPDNLARTRVRGIEGSARSSYLLAPGKSLNAGLIYAWTNAVDRSDSTEPSFGRQLRYVPRHQIKAYSGIRRGSWSLDVNGSYLGRRFVTSDETEAVEAALVLDARVSAVRDLGGLRARLSLEIDNVLDRRYAIIQSYPMPPRHARIALLIEARSHK
jgi:iron complex outermembrane receptor protein